MATDIKATVGSLQAQLRSLKCPLRLDADAAEAGSPALYLQALSWLLLQFSKHVALLVTEQGLQLRGASDLRFAEGVLRFARDALSLRPALSAAQLLADGQFARAKAALVLDVARACKERHNAAARQERLAALKSCHAEQRLYGAAAGPPAAALPVEQQHMGHMAARGSSIPRPPPPHVRVVSAAAQQQAAAAAGMRDCGSSASGRPKADDELSSEGSEGGVAAGAAVTPTSVVAAPAGAHGKLLAESRPLPGVQLPDASPADQPRALPAALLAARQANEQPRAGSLMHTAGARGAQASLLPLASYPQLMAAAQATQHPALDPPSQANGAGATGLAAQHPASAVAPQQVQQHSKQQAQLPPPLPLPHPAQLVQSSSLAVAASPIPANTCISGLLGDQQTQRLIEELQLRLALAEEAAAAARQEAQAAREQLQARVTILEGRVRFLEAGFELRPPHQPQLPMLLPGSACSQGQPQPPLALPAPRAAAGVVGAHTVCSSFGSSIPGAGSAGPTNWSVQAPVAASAAWQPLQQQPPLQMSGLQQHAHVNPLFESKQPAVMHGTPAGPGCQPAEAPGEHMAPALLSLAGSGCAKGQQAEQPLPQLNQQHSWQPELHGQPQAVQKLIGATTPPLAATTLCSSSNAAELIRSMQARFLEAEGFLLSLQRL